MTIFLPGHQTIDDKDKETPSFDGSNIKKDESTPANGLNGIDDDKGFK